MRLSTFLLVAPILLFLIFGYRNENKMGLSTPGQPESELYKTKYKRIEHYRVDSTTAVKTIKLGIHIWLKKNGEGKWVDNEQTQATLKQIEGWMNAWVTNNAESTEPFSSKEHIKDTRFRFSIEGVFFYYNDTVFNNASSATLNNYIAKYHPDRQQYMPIHCVNSGCPRGAGGSANGLSYQNHNICSVVTCMGLKTNSDYSIAEHLAHEICHNFGLMHTYDGNTCDGVFGAGDSPSPETMNKNSDEYVADIFNYEDNWCNSPDGACYECAKVPILPNIPGQANCSNNIMNGAIGYAYYFSPLQIAKMHRATHIQSVRQYTWGYSTTPYIIKDDETWDFNIKMYQDIVVKKGRTLIIKNELYMVPEARIVVEKGAKLIVDGGLITAAKWSPGPWKGVFVKKQRRKKGGLELINGGRIEQTVGG